MTDADGNDDDATARGELARLLAEVGRMGEEAAAGVVDRFAEMARRVWERDDAETPSPVAASNDELLARLRHARVDVERSLDQAADAIGRSLGSTGAIVDEALRRVGGQPDEPSGGREPVVVTVGADGRGTGRLWLHNTSDTALDEVALVAGDLRRHDGEALAAKVELRPGSVGPVVAGATREVSLEVAVSPAAGPGRYHGLVLGGPEPELTLRVVVEVPVDRDPDGAA